MSEIPAFRLLVVGASGDVGRGIVEAAVRSGLQVVAASRDAARLAAIWPAHARLKLVAGDLSSEAGAELLWTEAAASFGGLDAVVVAVNASSAPRPIFDWSAEALAGDFAANALTHFNAAKVFMPRLAADGVYIGIGGGTADFVFPKMGHISMAQAALRMMYRAIAREHREGPQIRELMIVSMVNGAKSRDHAEPGWVTDAEVGRHVCAILADPARFPGPILRLESREQVGQPEAAKGP